MHLEATLEGGKTSLGLVQILSLLANLTMQLQNMAKDKMRICHVLCATPKVTIGTSVLCWGIT
jgi:hypothetical protein